MHTQSMMMISNESVLVFVYIKAYAKQGQTTLLPLWSVEAQHSNVTVILLNRFGTGGVIWSVTKCHRSDYGNNRKRDKSCFKHIAG